MRVRIELKRDDLATLYNASQILKTLYTCGFSEMWDVFDIEALGCPRNYNDSGTPIFEGKNITNKDLSSITYKRG